MKNTTLKLEPDNTFTLQDIADKCKIDNIRTARHYLHDCLPKHHRQGKGTGSRYGDDTLNCFLFLLKLKKETPLRLEQIASVIAHLDQKQINRVVSGEEPLELAIAVKDSKGRVRLPEGYPVEEKRDSILIRGSEAQAISTENDQDGVHLSGDGKIYHGQQNDWNTLPLGDNLELRYKGNLNKTQLDELKIMSRLLNSIIENT